jgi:hypothetical protein
VERNDYLLLWLVVGAVVFFYSAARGADLLSSAVAGGFIGLLAVMLIRLGLEKIHE